MSQAGFGFPGVSFGQKPRVRACRVAVCGLFVMWDDGSGWFPLCAASDGLTLARALILERHPMALVQLVNESEVGK